MWVKEEEDGNRKRDNYKIGNNRQRHFPLYRAAKAITELTKFLALKFVAKISASPDGRLLEK